MVCKLYYIIIYFIVLIKGEMPRNTDEEVWKDLNTMNLFFNVDYNGGSASGSGTGQQNQEEVVNIASATLRLYRLPQVK